MFPGFASHSVTAHRMNLASVYTVAMKIQPVEVDRFRNIDAAHLKALVLSFPFTDWRNLGWEVTRDRFKGPD